MINNELRENISKLVDNPVLLNEPAFDDSIIGITSTGKVVYSKIIMILEYIQEYGGTKEGALQFINDYVNLLNNLDIENKPIILEVFFT